MRNISLTAKGRNAYQATCTDGMERSGQLSPVWKTSFWVAVICSLAAFSNQLSVRWVSKHSSPESCTQTTHCNRLQYYLCACNCMYIYICVIFIQILSSHHQILLIIMIIMYNSFWIQIAYPSESTNKCLEILPLCVPCWLHWLGKGIECTVKRQRTEFTCS